MNIKNKAWIFCLVATLTIGGNISMTQAQTFKPEPFHPIPSESQMRWHKAEYKMFCCFGLKTFYPSDYHMIFGEEDPTAFNPSKFNPNQWVEAVKAGGFAGLVLTLKHHEGFAIWQTKTTDYSVNSIPWKNGKGDILKDVIEACRAGGVSCGVYMSMIDKHYELYPSQNHENYAAFYNDQLKEICTKYGPIDEFWFDGYKAAEYKIDFEKIAAYIREYQQGAVVYDDGYYPEYLPGRCLRWEGAHGGAHMDQNYRVQEHVNWDYGKKIWYPVEPSLMLQGNWFHDRKPICSLQTIQDYYLNTTGHGVTPLMNVPPNQNGLYDEHTIKGLKEFKAWVDRLHSNDPSRKVGVNIYADGIRGNDPKYGPWNAIDSNYDTYYATDDNVKDAVIEVDLGKVQKIEGFIIQEYIPLGQRVNGYSLECFVEGQWVEVFAGKRIGYKRIILEGRGSAREYKFPSTDRIRLKINKALACPLINNFKVIGDMSNT